MRTIRAIAMRTQLPHILSGCVRNPEILLTQKTNVVVVRGAVTPKSNFQHRATKKKLHDELDGIDPDKETSALPHLSK